MDKLLLNTKFVKNMIARAVAKAVLKALGVAVYIDLESLEIEHEEGGRITVDICATASMDEESLSTLMDTIM